MNKISDPSEFLRRTIETHSFFKEIPVDVTNSLVKSAQVREYSKGKILFLEGEQPLRFYFIINGWIKLFKGNSRGDEAVIQMLGKGDTAGGSAVFLNTSYPISAQVVEDSTLISFPGSIIRNFICDNNQLAINMLITISKQSQKLFHLLESTRLKSAEERVGWYLLKLLLDQGKYEDAIRLPYDKSTIASYLDMKPETFSRTLKKFKQQGFRIENDTIVLPEVSALCSYCDVETASNCSKHLTDECSNPQDIEGIRNFN